MGEEATFSIDDLPGPMTEMPRLGGPGPFVINLATASVPIALPQFPPESFPGTLLYQLQRTEERRVRFRLRLGPFGTEDAADIALLKVRERYPGALTATAAEDDLRIVGPLAHQPAAVPTERAALPSGAATLTTQSATLTTQPMMAHARVEQAFDLTELALVDDDALLSPPPPPQNSATVSFESTQTIRPLTELELAEEEQSPCFVIQLATAAQTFDPEDLPSLDIFSCYRLYSVAVLTRVRIEHALRLGFFSTEIAARAVQSYIVAHYPSAKIERVSGAERERFDERPSVEARKDVGATGTHAVIEITDERVPRPRTRPAATQETHREPKAARAR